LDGNFFEFLMAIWKVFLVLHAEKIGLNGKFICFRWQYGTYFSFACGEE
jgi:hypothetical protein